MTNDHGDTEAFPLIALLPPEIPPKRFERRPKVQKTDVVIKLRLIKIAKIFITFSTKK